MTGVAQREYAKIVSEWPPRVLRTPEEYEVAIHRAGELIRLDDRRSEAQTEYYELLVTLIKSHDEKHSRPLPRLDPLDFLVEAMKLTGITQAQVGHAIGRQAASAILSGARGISKAQAKALAQLFKVDAGSFI
jgi:antitoxin component HigA of HigAB toxin-antitoxin module